MTPLERNNRFRALKKISGLSHKELGKFALSSESSAKKWSVNQRFISMIRLERIEAELKKRGIDIDIDKGK